jgi:hypothetical protein
MIFWNAWRPLADVRFANPTTCRGDSELSTSRTRNYVSVHNPDGNADNLTQPV